MKKILLLAVFLFSSALLAQQNFEPASLPIIENGSMFKKDFGEHFYRGWNWHGFHRRIDSAMFMNGYHTGKQWNPTMFMDSILVIDGAVLGSGVRDSNLLQAFSMQFDPELDYYVGKYGDVEQYIDFVPQNDATAGAVWGFRNKSDYVSNDGKYIKLTPDSNISPYQPILSEPYPNNEMIGKYSHIRGLKYDSLLSTFYSRIYSNEYVLYTSESKTGLSNHPLQNGMQWYITLQVRIDSISVSEDWLSSVLSVKVPYYKTRITKLCDTCAESDTIHSIDTHYIRFDSVSINGTGGLLVDTVMNNNFRGYYARLTPVINHPDTNFLITKGLLYNLQNAGINEVTVSAFFRLDAGYTLDDTFFHYDTTINGKTITIHDSVYIFDSTRPINSINPLLHTAEWRNNTDSSLIDSIGLEVYYHNNAGISIDWIRFETPHARALFQGQLDNSIEQRLKDARDSSNGDRCFNIFHASRGSKIYRVYGVDEFWVEDWLSHRYVNKLLDGYLISELYQDVLQEQFNHCLNFAPIDRGATFSFGVRTAAPYIKEGGRWYNNFGQANAGWISSNLNNTIFTCLNYHFGYKGFALDSANLSEYETRNLLNSEYETFLYDVVCTRDAVLGNKTKYFRNTAPLGNYSYDIFRNSSNYMDPGKVDSGTIYYYPYATSFQYYLENKIYYSYFRNNKFLYDTNRTWLTNLWLSSSYPIIKQKDTNTLSIYHTSGDARAITGEEARLSMMFPIILGSKGFLYWWGSQDFGGRHLGLVRYKNIDTSVPGKLLRESINRTSLRGDSLLFSNFMDTTNNSISLGEDYVSLREYVRLDSVKLSKKLGASYANLDIDIDTSIIDTNMIYLGTRSVRAEVAKMNRWLSAVEETLMSLQLKSWYGKGYTKMLSGDTGLLNDNIDIDNIRTYSLRKLKSENTPYYDTTSEQTSASDSGFYDITILQNKNITDPDIANTEYYIGVLNRRTDPLIYDTAYYLAYYNKDSVALDTLSPDITGQTDRITFFSTYDFENKCGIDHINNIVDTASERQLWSNLWWHRLGCRQIRLPLKSQGHGQYYAIKVTELGMDTFLDTLRYRDKNYYHKVDTVFYANNAAPTKELVVNLQPGEGKILKVKYIKNPPSFAGNLEYSNQHKCVCYPTAIDSTTGKILKYRYHIVYMDETKKRILYKRSLEMSGAYPGLEVDTISEVISWEVPELLVSASKNVYYPYRLLDAETNDDCSPRMLDQERSYSYPSIVVRPHKPYNVYVEDIRKTCDDSSYFAGRVDRNDTLRYSYLTDEPYVYIVFQDNCGNGLSIYEVKFPVLENLDYNGAFEMVSCLHRNDFVHPDTNTDDYRYGTPVINASANYNYYAWTEYREGNIGSSGLRCNLTYSYKSPERDELENYATNAYQSYPSILSFYSDGYGPLNPDTIASGRAFNPSVNQYSRMLLNEDECAIVWEEKRKLNDSNIHSDIFYTRIKESEHYIHNSNISGNPYKDSTKGKVDFNITNKIAKISNYDLGNHTTNRFPVIYRGTETEVFSPDVLKGIHWDRIIWATRGPSDILFNNQPLIHWLYASLRMIDITDSVFNYYDPATVDTSNYWQPYYPVRYYNYKDIFSYRLETSNTYLTGGTLQEQSNRAYKPYRISDNNNLSITIDNIWHIRQSYWGFSNNHNTINGVIMAQQLNTPMVLNLTEASGNNLHFSNLPIVSDTSDKHLYRRIFEKGDNINTNANTFLKRNLNDENNYLVMFGFVKDSNKAMLSNFLLNDNYDIKFDGFDMDAFTQSPKDTLISEWLTISNDSVNLVFKRNSNNAMLRLEIEEWGTHNTTTIPLTNSEILDTNFINATLYLTNGYTGLYRFRIFKTDPTALYSEEMHLGAIPKSTEANINNKLTAANTGNNHITINLKKSNYSDNLIIYPNPTDAKLNVTLGSLPTDKTSVRASIHAITGTKLMEFILEKNSTKTLDLQQLKTGTYILQIEYTNNETEQNDNIRKTFLIK